MEHLLTSAGYTGLIVLAFVEACCVPIPSEVTMGYAGVLAGTHRLDLALVIVIGTLAELAGSFVSYTVGRRGGRPLVQRLGRYLLVTSADLDKAEHFFDGRGEFALALGRALPVVRAFASVVAGIAEMGRLRFLTFSLIGTAAYVGALAALGDALGSQWHRIVHDFKLASYVVVALVVVAVALALRHRIAALRAEKLRVR